MSIVIGQLPHFDISTPNFDPIGSSYSTNKGPGPGGIFFNKIVITYGSSVGASRTRLALRRYVYAYTQNSFNFIATYKGVRNKQNLPFNVGDIDDLNARFAIHGQQITNEGEPYYISQVLLKSLFLYPNYLDYFFLDGSHYGRRGASSDGVPKPNFFEIYRYGKLSKDDITKVVSYKNNLLAARSKI
jgi:hypothetical protein